MKQLVSVVMSVFNAEKYLREAIESILCQTFKDFEFIIINDGSSDRSLEIIKSYSDKRIRLINQKNTGLAKALNIGISKSKSDLIARMDADDISLPNRLKKQYNFLAKHPDYVAIGNNAIVIDINGNIVHTTSKPTTNKECKRHLPSTPFIHPSVMFRKDAFLKAGGYSEKMYTAQDLVLFNRMSNYGKFYNIKESLIKYRVVPTSNSSRSKIKVNKYYEILNKAIKTNMVTDEDFEYLKSLTSNRNSDDRYANYHIFLAKKYLRNNYQPKLARDHLLNSLKYVFHITSLFYYFFTFLPEIIINKLYGKFK